MTVYELIQFLREFPEETPIVRRRDRSSINPVWDAACGVGDPVEVTKRTGLFGIVYYVEPGPGDDRIDAIEL